MSTVDSSEGCNFHGPVQLPPFMLYPKLDINLAHLLKISGKDSIFSQSNCFYARPVFSNHKGDYKVKSAICSENFVLFLFSKH